MPGTKLVPETTQGVVGNSFPRFYTENLGHPQILLSGPSTHCCCHRDRVRESLWVFPDMYGLPEKRYKPRRGTAGMRQSLDTDDKLVFAHRDTGCLLNLGKCLQFFVAPGACEALRVLGTEDPTQPHLYSVSRSLFCPCPFSYFFPSLVPMPQAWLTND